MNNNDTFEAALDRHLKKCELEFRAKHGTKAQEVDWLAPHCDSLEEIADTLRGLGFKIKQIMDDEPMPGEVMRWVETTSGIIVYANDKYSRGLVAGATKDI